MTDTVDTTTAFGRPIRRKEDAKLLHGRTNWTDNIQLPGTAAHGARAQLRWLTPASPRSTYPARSRVRTWSRPSAPPISAT